MLRSQSFGLASLFVLAACSSSSTSNPLVVADSGTVDAVETGSDEDTNVDTGPPPLVPKPTPADPAVICPIVMPVDANVAKRASCTFTAGATPHDTLGVQADSGGSYPIRHVIVLMRENRAFDHLLGKLHDDRPDVEAVPGTFANDDKAGVSIKPFHAETTCIHSDPIHQWNSMHNAVNGGKMDGFVKNAADTTGTDGHFAMSYYDKTDLPFEYWLNTTWPISDHHFASIRSGTTPDRAFMLLATNDGIRQTGLDYPDPATPSILNRLNDANYSWGAYSDGSPLEGVLNWDRSHPGTGNVTDFLALLDSGKLPNVAFVDASEGTTDDHPTADLQRGEAWVKAIYDHAIKSPQWERLAIVWTYDEGGAFADHVPPPNDWCVARPGNPKDTPYFELGVRVPFAVISPWAKPNFVSHVPQEHTVITRFIETMFGLPALTSRDANSSALLEFFDFSSCTPPMKTPPVAPAAGTGGCK